MKILSFSRSNRIWMSTWSNGSGHFPTVQVYFVKRSLIWKRTVFQIRFEKNGDADPQTKNGKPDPC